MKNTDMVVEAIAANMLRPKHFFEITAAALSSLRQIKDGQGAYLFQHGQKTPETLFGEPVHVVISDKEYILRSVVEVSGKRIEKEIGVDQLFPEEGSA